MKLKQVFEANYNDSNPNFRGAGWDVEPEHNEPEAKTEVVTVKYVTVDNTTVDLKVEVTYDVVNQQAVLYSAEPVAVILQPGKEVDIDTARNVLGTEEFDDESVLITAQEYLETSIEGVKSVTIDKSAQKTPQAAAPGQPAAAPAAAPAMAPTAA